MALRGGIEPPTWILTVSRSTTELPQNGASEENRTPIKNLPCSCVSVTLHQLDRIEQVLFSHTKLNLCQKLVLSVGLEPTRPKSPGSKPGAYTIPPREHVLGLRRALLSPAD